MTPLPVVVELVELWVDGPSVRWRTSRCRVQGLHSPDALARELAAVPAAAAGVVLHSTSWRHTGAELLLTYAVFPARAISGAPLPDHVAVGAGPLHPSPPQVDDGQVAAHAARHLADLVDRDPHVASCARERPVEWGLLLRHGATVHAHLPEVALRTA